MINYNKSELEESLRQFSSLISKSEKVLLKLKENSPQYTLTARRIKAYHTAVSLIEKELNGIRAKLYPVILLEYNDKWADWYNTEKTLIEKYLSKEGIVINHIGSTAVPGLVSKPIIDILLEIDKNTDLQEIKSAFPQTDYICLEKQTIDTNDIMLFLKGYTDEGFTQKVFHIHVRYKGDWDEIIFRDFLRANPQTAKEYAQLKLRLKEKYEFDRDGYTLAKGEFIADIVNQAKAK